MYYKAKTGIISILNMGYTKIALKGVSWMSSFRVVSRGLSFVKIAVLARVLTPSQFGVFGVASLVLTLLEIFLETGINIILIQVKKDIKDYVDSAWTLSIIRGIIISLAIIISAPFVASFFRTPDALGILLFISIVPFIRGFINPAEVKFRKELNFNYEFWFRTSIFFVDAVVSIIFSLLTHSVYSLVFGLLAGAILEVVVSFVLIKPTPKFTFRNSYLKEIFHKGKWITAYGIFNYFGENGDNIVVGRILGASSLGLYQMAYKLSILPISEVSDVVSGVVFPVYSKIEGDQKRLVTAFIKTMISIVLGAILVGGILFAFPTQIVSIALGPQWLSIVPIIKVLVVFGVLRTISGPSSAVFLARGKQNYVTAMTFARSAVLIVAIFPLVSAYGMIGAAYAQIFSAIVEYPVILFLFYKTFKKTI